MSPAEYVPQLVCRLTRGIFRVRNKMENGDGMSFAEFCYPLMQSWDWWHMYQEMGIQVQIGGSDQYGNIVAGMDVIKHLKKGHLDEDKRRKAAGHVEPMGLTVPLLTTSSGEKFGKSAGNAVWLDPNSTTSFELYQVKLEKGCDCYSVI